MISSIFLHSEDLVRRGRHYECIVNLGISDGVTRPNIAGALNALGELRFYFVLSMDYF